MDKGRPASDEGNKRHRGDRGEMMHQRDQEDKRHNSNKGNTAHKDNQRNRVPSGNQRSRQDRKNKEKTEEDWGPQKPLECKGSSAEIEMEAEAALENCKMILSTAENLAARSALAKLSMRFRIEPLRELVQFLVSVLTIIKEGRMAEEESRYVDVAEKNFSTLCPMTLLLQIIADSLTELGVMTSERTWGSVDPLRDQLHRVHSKLKKRGIRDSVLAGVAMCFLFHEENGVLTVVSTTPSYSTLTGLRYFGSFLRRRRLRDLRKQITNDRAIQQIKERLEQSQSILLRYRAKMPEWEMDFRGLGPVEISGRGATFDQNAQYKAACAIDFCRFAMDRYEKGNASERSRDWYDRGAVASDTCAEWEFWLVKLSRGPIKPPPDPRLLPYNPNLVHRANSFPRPAGGKPAAPSTPYSSKQAHPPDRRWNFQNNQIPKQRDDKKLGRASSWDHGGTTGSKQYRSDGQKRDDHPTRRRNREHSSDSQPQAREKKRRGCFGF